MSYTQEESNVLTKMLHISRKQYLLFVCIQKNKPSEVIRK